MTSIRSSKNSSNFHTGEATPVDLNSQSSGQPVGFTGRVERVDAFSSCSAVIDLLPGLLQPNGQNGGLARGILTLILDGGDYAVGDTGAVVGATSGASNATYSVASIAAGGAISGITITHPGSGYKRGEVVDLQKTTGTGVGASFIATSVLSDLDQKEVALEIYLSSVDPTDKSAFPAETNSAVGGGLTPTQDQLDKYFNKQFLSNEAALQYSDTKPDASQCVAVCSVTQSFMVVQAFSKPSGSASRTYPGIQLLARIESYLYSEALPLASSDPMDPVSGATEKTQLLVEGHTKAVMECVNPTTNHLKVDVQNAAGDAHSVELVNGGAAVSASNPLAVDGRISLDSNHNIYPVARDAGGAARGILVDTNNRIQADVTGVGQALAGSPGGYTSKVLLTDDQGRLLVAPQAFTVAPTIPTPFLPSTANPTFDLSFRPAATNHPTYRLVARRARFCLTWYPLNQPTPPATIDDASKEFLLSMSDDGSSWNGLVRYQVDPQQDAFYDAAGHRFYSVNMDLGRCTPRHLSIQNLGASGTGMLTATCRIFCEA